jgi:hypothetical protein
MVLPKVRRRRLLKKISARSPAELEARLLEAAKSLDAGKGVDAEEAFARLRQRRKPRRQ